MFQDTDIIQTYNSIYFCVIYFKTDAGTLEFVTTDLLSW